MARWNSRAGIDLGELGTLAKLDARPEGTLVANGIAKLDANNNYEVGGNIQAQNVAFEFNGQRLQQRESVFRGASGSAYAGSQGSAAGGVGWTLRRRYRSSGFRASTRFAATCEILNLRASQPRSAGRKAIRL